MEKFASDHRTSISRLLPDMISEWLKQQYKDEDDVENKRMHDEYGK